MFQLKDFRSILASLVNLTRGSTGLLTDFNPGSVVRTLLEAPAAEVEELYLQTYHGIMDAIPVAIYGAFDFDRQAAVAAWGYVIFSRATAATSDITIPLGTQIRTSDGTVYATDAAVTLATGQTSVVAVARCGTAGAAGNVLAGTLTVLGQAISGIDSVTNPEHIITGRDLETDDERKDRFREYVLSLPSGTVASIIYGAKRAEIISNGIVIERVISAAVIEPFRTDLSLPAGYVRLVIASGPSLASDALVARTQQIIDGYRDDDGQWIPGYAAAGVIVTVEAARRHRITVTTTLTLAANVDATDVQAAVVSAQTAYLSTLDIGSPVLRAELIAAAMEVPGVVNAILTSPAEDILTDNDILPVLGSITTEIAE